MRFLYFCRGWNLPKGRFWGDTGWVIFVVLTDISECQRLSPSERVARVAQLPVLYCTGETNSKLVRCRKLLWIGNSVFTDSLPEMGLKSCKREILLLRYIYVKKKEKKKKKKRRGDLVVLTFSTLTDTHAGQGTQGLSFLFSELLRACLIFILFLTQMKRNSVRACPIPKEPVSGTSVAQLLGRTGD